MSTTTNKQDAEFVIELTKHKKALSDRLSAETDRYERIAYEDQIIAVEALIAGFVARPEAHTAIAKAIRNDS